MMHRSAICRLGYGLADWFKTPKGNPKAFSTWPQLYNRRIIQTYKGRTAIHLACKILDIGSGSEVLFPSYNCGSELDAIINTGATIVPYRVNRDSSIDIGHLISQITSRTKAIYVIHYFGWIQPLEHLRKLCDERGLLLIEDCALSLFSTGHDNITGRYGDAAIFSLAKTYGFKHGGLLSLSPNSNCTNLSLDPAPSGTYPKELKHSFSGEIVSLLSQMDLLEIAIQLKNKRSGSNNNVKESRFPDIPTSYYFNAKEHANRTLLPKLESIALYSVPEEIVKKRRTNYNHLSESLSDIEGIEPLFKALPDGICPLAYPLSVNDRNKTVHLLETKGIEAYPWWSGYHPSIVDWSQFPDACWLKDHLLTLPIHQNLNLWQIDYIAQEFKKLL